MSEKQKVRFIRVNGRVVPIRGSTKANDLRQKAKPKKKASEQASVKKGFAFVAAGAGISSVSGYVAGKLFKKSTKLGKEAANMTSTASFALGKTWPGGFNTPMGDKVGNILLRGAAKRARKTAEKIRASKATFRFGAGFLGGLLVGQGFEELLRARSKNGELSDLAELSSGAAGQLSVLAGMTAFRKSAGKNLIKKILSKGKL